MEIIIVLGVAALTLSIILSGVYLICRRTNQYCAISARHEQLVARIGKTRLGRMLRSLGINLYNYVRTFPAATVESHIRTCQNCDSWRACDHYLASDERHPQAAHTFCPNMKEFDKLVKEAGN